MNDTKPTAKAATTVVSTPPRRLRRARSPAVERGQLASSRRASSGSSARAPRRPARRAARRQRRGAIATPTSASDARADRARGRRRGRSRPRRASPSTRGPYSAASARLICAFVVPSAIRRRMNARSRSATARLGDVQRRAALHAHDLVLDVGQRRARRRRRRRGGRRRAASAASSAAQALLTAAARTFCVEPRLVDRPAPQRGDAPVAVDHERLRIAVRAEAPGELAVDVAQARIREVEAPDVAERVLRGVLDVRRRARSRRAAAERAAVRSSSGSSSTHGGHHEAQKFMTTTLPR